MEGEKMITDKETIKELGAEAQIKKMTEFKCDICNHTGFNNKKSLSNHKRWHNPTEKLKNSLKGKNNPNYKGEIEVQENYQNYQKVYQNNYHKNKGRQKFLIRMNTLNHNEKTGVCSNCKERKSTEFHHIYYEPNIFIELCSKCHKEQHNE